MKRLVVYIVLVLVFSACNFLDREPWDSVDTTNGFKTEADAIVVAGSRH